MPLYLVPPVPKRGEFPRYFACDYKPDLCAACYMAVCARPPDPRTRKEPECPPPLAS
jgi:hypothetical protein